MPRYSGAATTLQARPPSKVTALVSIWLRLSASAAAAQPSSALPVRRLRASNFRSAGLDKPGAVWSACRGGHREGHVVQQAWGRSMERGPGAARVTSTDVVYLAEPWRASRKRWRSGGHRVIPL